MNYLENITILDLSSDSLGAKVVNRFELLGAKTLIELPENDFDGVDIVIYNKTFWTKFEMSEEQFEAKYPRLILAEYSAFGSHSAWSEKEAQESEVQALSGLCFMNGDRDDEPQIAALALGAEFCVSYLIQGILAALYDGKTRRISCSLMESLLAIQSDFITTSIAKGGSIAKRARKGNAHCYSPAPYGVYKSRDGYFAMSVTPTPKFAQILGIEIEERMRERKGWVDYKDEIMALFAAEFQKKTNQEWLDIFEPLDVWCAAVLSSEEIQNHEGYKALEIKEGELPFKIKIDERDGEKVPASSQNNKLLSGLRVIDFSQFLSAPSATLQLADLGAQVIKIERPKFGESGRDIIFDNVYMDGESSEFMTVNRNKFGYAADLKDPTDRAKIRELIRKADVLVHNFRPSAIERLGLDYESVKAINPQIIYADISGYGKTGCWRDKPGQDLIVQAISGVTMLKGKVPRPIGAPVVDLIAGAYLCEGILAALNYQKMQKQKNKASSVHIQTTMLSSILNVAENKNLSYEGDFWDWNSLFASNYGKSLNMLQRVECANGYSYKTTRCPLRIDGEILYRTLGAPKVGEHTKQIDKQP